MVLFRTEELRAEDDDDEDEVDDNGAPLDKSGVDRGNSGAAASMSFGVRARGVANEDGAVGGTNLCCWYC